MVAQRTVWLLLSVPLDCILCLHSVGVVADIKGSDTRQNRRANEPSNSWFDSREVQSIPPTLLQSVQSGCGAHLACLAPGTDDLSNDEVTFATRSSFRLLNPFFLPEALSLRWWVLGASVIVLVRRRRHHHQRHCHCKLPVRSSVYQI